MSFKIFVMFVVTVPSLQNIWRSPSAQIGKLNVTIRATLYGDELISGEVRAKFPCAVAQVRKQT